MAAATYQNAAGPNITGNWAATSAPVGRTLSGGANQTKTINLIQPQTVFGDRLNQIDVHLGKRLTIGNGARLALNDAKAAPVLKIWKPAGPPRCRSDTT